MTAEKSDSRRILVVDDEEDVRLLFNHQFRREIRSGQLTFTFAHSSAEALEVLRTQAQDIALVFSDINMPGGSGLELLLQIREEFGPLPVHMVSAYGDEDHIRAATERGANGFLTKPIDFATLRREAVEA